MTWFAHSSQRLYSGVGAGRSGDRQCCPLLQELHRRTGRWRGTRIRGRPRVRATSGSRWRRNRLRVNQFDDTRRRSARRGSRECEPLRVAFEGELPSQIADARSLVLDFEFARNCALLYQNLDNVSIDEPSQEVPQQALWSAAAISYRRGFSTGKALLQPQAKRLKVPDNWLNLLSPEQRKLTLKFWKLRVGRLPTRLDMPSTYE